ncbi:MAG: TRAP transporter substrate-binding protein [Planctomycetes bacterium]|jgi:tripartite ATP-independent transporter DctP family solute receptor|nr:TRAP transporter substrate-binding protein [Planctomycetota bacterium]
MDKKSVSFFAVGLVTGLIVAVSGFTLYVRNLDFSGSDKIVLKLAHGLDPSHPVHKGMLYMAEQFEKKSGGRATIQVISGGVLGSERDNIEQLQKGSLAMTKVSAAAMEIFIPEMAVFGLPYIFRDHDHFWGVLNSPVGRELLTMGNEAGLRGLCYYDSGSRNFYTTQKPILSPDDLRGLKIRVMESRTAMDMIRVMGGEPTPISWGELYTSLQQGVIDGAENNPPSFYTSRHYEVCKYFSMDEHTRIPDVLLINADVWESLPPEVQRWLQEAADESSVYQRKLWAIETEKALEEVQKRGVEVSYPDLKPFVEKVQPLIQRYNDTPVGEFVKRIQETQ